MKEESMQSIKLMNNEEQAYYVIHKREKLEERRKEMIYNVQCVIKNKAAGILL